jgi:hypothetical protein
VGSTCDQRNHRVRRKANTEIEISYGQTGLHTEVDVSLASSGAGSGGHGGDRAALLEGDEVVEVVEIGEHLTRQKILDQIKYNF